MDNDQSREISLQVHSTYYSYTKNKVVKNVLNNF